MRRRRLKLPAIALLLLPILACDSDGESGGPTQPPSSPSIAGLWNGNFSVPGGLTSLVTMDLKQTGRIVTGDVAVGGLVWSLQGAVDSNGRFTWDTAGSTCGSFDGTVRLEDRTSLDGNAELDRFACPEGERRRGDVVLRKVG